VVGLHFALQGFRRGVSALAHASSFLYPPLLGHREGNIGLAPSGTAVLCFGFVALWVLVPPTAQVPSKKSAPGHLGAAIPRVRPG
jgi:hypothetical protein